MGRSWLKVRPDAASPSVAEIRRTRSQRPPDVPESGEPRHYVAQVGIVVPLIHSGESPLIVRMEEDDVRFNSKGGEIADSRFVMSEELGVKPAQVELAGLRLHVREQRRGHAIEQHPLGKNHESHLVKRVARKRRERANLEVAVAIQPVVQSRAKGKLRDQIGIGEMALILNHHGAVIARTGIDNGKRPGFSVQFRIGRYRCERPCSRGVRYEADLPCMIAVVKAVDRDLFPLRAEAALNGYVRAWIAISLPRLQGNLLDAPPLDPWGEKRSVIGSCEDACGGQARNQETVRFENHSDVPPYVRGGRRVVRPQPESIITHHPRFGAVGRAPAFLLENNRIFPAWLQADLPDAVGFGRSDCLASGLDPRDSLAMRRPDRELACDAGTQRTRNRFAALPGRVHFHVAAGAQSVEVDLA